MMNGFTAPAVPLGEGKRGEGNCQRAREEGALYMAVDPTTGQAIKGVRSKRKFWSRYSLEYLEEAYAYLQRYLFEQYPEYQQLWEEEVQEHLLILFWIAYQLLQDTEQTHDCVMDALKNACVAIQRYTPQQVEQLQVVPWLKAIIRNEAIDMCKKRDRLEVTSLEQMVEQQGTDSPLWYPLSREQIAQQPEIVLLQQEACHRLAEVFALLPERQAYAIRTHFLQEQRHHVTAQAFGISEKGANMLSVRGLRTLRKAVLTAGLHASDFYAENFQGILTQFILSDEDSA
jgi:RNA polymerase sigma factor (sigma-70 family)